MSNVATSDTWPKPHVPRELPVALAQQMVKTKPGTPYMQTLVRIFLWLPFSEQFQCRLELDRCRAAKRGKVMAVVMP